MSIAGKEAIIKNLTHKCDAQAQELDALRTLLAPAPALLELAAALAQATSGMADCGRCPERDGCPAYGEDAPGHEQWPCYKAPAQLRELAQALRALDPEPAP